MYVEKVIMELNISDIKVVHMGNSQNRCRYGGSEHNFFLNAENGVLIFFNI